MREVCVDSVGTQLRDMLENPDPVDEDIFINDVLAPDFILSELISVSPVHWSETEENYHCDVQDIEWVITREMIENKGRLGFYNVIRITNEELGSAFLCAILPAGNQTLFVKLSADPKGVREIETDFISFCSSLTISI